jgi:hypothetical protein
MVRKLFGSLDFARMVGRGENPNGVVQQTSNGTWVNREGADGDDFVWFPADGPRWNKTEPDEGRLADMDVPRPIAIVASRRK